MLIGTTRAPWRAASARICCTVRRMLSPRAENGLPASRAGGVLSSMSNAPISGVIAAELASLTRSSEMAQARPSASMTDSSSSVPMLRAFAVKVGPEQDLLQHAQLVIESLLEAQADPLRRNDRF